LAALAYGQNSRIEEDLIDQLFNSSEKRLASPDGYSLDNFCLARTGADEIQLDLLGDYKSNVALYISELSPDSQATFPGCLGKERSLFRATRSRGAQARYSQCHDRKVFASSIAGRVRHSRGAGAAVWCDRHRDRVHWQEHHGPTPGL
jgi:hypothetical protein